MSTESAHQGGWIANFLIVGALLVFGLIGTIYFLKSRSADRVAIEDTQTAQNETTTQKTDEQKSTPKTHSKKDSEKKDTSKDEKTTSQSEKEPARSNATNNSSDDEHKEPRELPATGPAETLQALIGVSLLTFSASVYVQSRRTYKL